MSTLYEITGSVRAFELVRPQTATVSDGHIRGTYLKHDGNVEYICAADWKDLPHVALANLLTYDKNGNPNMKPELGLRIDEKAIQGFIRTYGVLNGVRKNRERAHINENDKLPEAGSFDQKIAEIVDLQYYLRLAWKGHAESSDDPILHIEGEVMNDAFKVFFDGPAIRFLQYAIRKPSHYKYEKVVLGTDDLSKLICYSFLRDFYAGKTGVCGNPGCPARYFLKRRKDQRYCTGAGPVEEGRKPSADHGPDSGSCAAYAQRQYSLNWWRENRQGKGAKTRAKSPRKKRN